MKLRYGFVSNSSSASFVLGKQGLSQEMIAAIRNHWDYAHEHHFACIQQPYLSPSDQWHIEETATELHGSTCMDNFDMQSFMAELFDQFKLPFLKYERDSF